MYLWGRETYKKDKDRREGKGRRCWLGDVLECPTNQLPARMIWTKVFGRTSILVGWLFGIWCEPYDHKFSQSIHLAKKPCYSIHPSFFPNHTVENSYSAARNLTNSIPQTAATTFAFSSVCILLLGGGKECFSLYINSSGSKTACSSFRILWNKCLLLVLSLSPPLPLTSGKEKHFRACCCS